MVHAPTDEVQNSAYPDRYILSDPSPHNNIFLIIKYLNPVSHLRFILSFRPHMACPWDNAFHIKPTIHNHDRHSSVLQLSSSMSRMSLSTRSNRSSSYAICCCVEFPASVISCSFALRWCMGACCASCSGCVSCGSRCACSWCSIVVSGATTGCSSLLMFICAACYSCVCSTTLRLLSRS